MKQQTLIELTIPVRAEALPTIHEDGTYELLWEWGGGSYVRLLFEKGDLVREMLGKVAMMESAQRQQAQAEAPA